MPDKDGKPILAKGEIPAGAAVVVPLKNTEPILQEVQKP